MDTDKIKAMMTATVSMTCDQLTSQELAVLNIVAQLDGSPYGRIFDYEKVKALFTAADGTRMHEETKLALAEVVSRRLE